MDFDFHYNPSSLFKFSLFPLTLSIFLNTKHDAAQMTVFNDLPLLNQSSLDTEQSVLGSFIDGARKVNEFAMENIEKKIGNKTASAENLEEHHGFSGDKQEAETSSLSKRVWGTKMNNKREFLF